MPDESSYARIFPDGNENCRKIFGAIENPVNTVPGCIIEGSLRTPLRHPCPQGGGGANDSAVLPVPGAARMQVIQRHRNKGTPTRWGRRLAGAPRSVSLLIVTVGTSHPTRDFSVVDLRNAHRSHRTADLTLS